MKEVLRILIVDDEYDNGKCKKLRKLLDENGIVYEGVKTLEAAKMELQNTRYDGAIVDRSFPEKIGKIAIGNAGEQFVSFVEERGIDLPILIFSTMLGTLSSEIIFEHMSVLEQKKVKSFIDFLAEKK